MRNEIEVSVAKNSFINEVALDELQEFLEADSRGVVIWLKVKPGASKEKLFLSSIDECCLAVSQPAVDNAANDRVCEIMSQLFGIKKSAVEIISGQRSKKKKILIRGAMLSQLLESYEDR